MFLMICYLMITMVEKLNLVRANRGGRLRRPGDERRGVPVGVARGDRGRVRTGGPVPAAKGGGLAPAERGEAGEVGLTDLTKRIFWSLAKEEKTGSVSKPSTLSI